MDYSRRLDKLAQLIRESTKTLALTGAGVSTESGIPDFRSKEKGLWNRFDPEEVASIGALERDPAEFYRNNLKWWELCLQAQPNEAHRSLAQLERKGWLLGVITQNIDGLHQKAGSKRVWEVHGHLRTCRCMKCKKTDQMDRLKESYHCAACGGLLRPSVVLFGDSMSNDYYNAEKVMSGCQLLLVVGSSLQVYPVAGLPYMARQVVIINRQPTPWDSQARLVINQSAGLVLSDLVEILGDEKGPYYEC
ncbi:SIR2 family NAD-dependent protein deacylase [Desulfofalx alkaliphila]|uniref:SIR2 family NAD-dependent protein deacylase n=1 Tax=Desulfofalx alkaliphila TaxID=105483 RepID=UPI0004E167EC|nr:NAD-dependent deacylase [Desulfofalx alkaliphila]